jgi:hypothetical protein
VGWVFTFTLAVYDLVRMRRHPGEPVIKAAKDGGNRAPAIASESERILAITTEGRCADEARL